MSKLNANPSTRMAANHYAVRPELVVIYEKNDADFASCCQRHCCLCITAAYAHIFHNAPDCKFFAWYMQSGFDIAFQALVLPLVFFRRSAIHVCVYFF